MEKSQKQQVREWLESGRSLTPLEALDNMGSMRLASIIEILRNKEGVPIDDLNKTGSERYAKYAIRQKLPTPETPTEALQSTQAKSNSKTRVRGAFRGRHKLSRDEVRKLITQCSKTQDLFPPNSVEYKKIGIQIEDLSAKLKK